MVAQRSWPEETTTGRIPDVLGAVVGWRAWRVKPTVEGVRLVSVTCDHLWSPSAWNVATCWHNKPHAAPAELCTCGFYAARNRAHLVTTEYGLYSAHAQKGWQRRPKVIGEVELARKVIPAANGFRAMWARPRRILVPYEFPGYVKPLRAAYPEADVELANTLLLPPEATPNWCARCGATMFQRRLRCRVCGNENEP